MQTFLPYKDFKESAKILDYRRLGKQRIEARQIIDILEGKNRTNAWVNHPAVQMWKGHVEALKKYFNVISKEWISRGYKHTIGFYEELPEFTIKYPKWLGNEDFHMSHRSNLMRKDEKYYGRVFGSLKTDLPYYWPTKKE